MTTRMLERLVKAADFPDNPPNPAYQPAMGDMHRVLQLHSTDQPEVHEIAADMRAIADSYGASGRGERVLIGEIYLPVRSAHELLRQGPERCEPSVQFPAAACPGSALDVAEVIDDYHGGVLPQGAWPNWVLGNHDKPRIASRGRRRPRPASRRCCY